MEFPDALINIALKVASVAADEIKAQRQLRQYINRQANDYLGRDWVMDIGGGDWRLPLRAAFVPLNLANNQGREISFREAFDRFPKIVIQGPPGAGKTTCVRWLALTMAQAFVTRNGKQITERCLGDAPHVPISIELRNFRRGVDLWKDLILPSLDQDLARPLSERVLVEQRVMYLMDGLDEVSADAYRALLEQIIHLADAPRNQRCIVTTRTATYRAHELAAGGFVVLSVQPLNQRQRELLVERYFHAWADAGVNPRQIAIDRQAHELIAQLEGSETLRQFASSPLLLALIAALYYEEIARPELFTNKSEIYRKCIEHLVQRRQRQRRSEGALQEQITLLSELAWAVQGQQTGAALSQAFLADLLANIVQRRNLHTVLINDSQSLTEQLEIEWGLLVGGHESRSAGMTYSFAQQSFQAYLAANAVREFSDEYRPILLRNLRSEHWRDVLLLYAAMSTDGTDIAPIDRVLQVLIPKRSKSLSPEDAILAGICLGALGSRLEQRRDYLIVRTFILDQLIFLVRRGIPQSAAALEALALIVPDGCERAAAWMREAVESGQSINDIAGRMSSEARQSLRSYLNHKLVGHKDIHERITLAQLLACLGDSRIGDTAPLLQGDRTNRKDRLVRFGVYPVTNAEYVRFVEDTRHSPPRDWVGGRPLPEQLNYPVTDVSYCDAQAYCEWSSCNLEHEVFLPDEREWLTLAAGPSDANLYPWGYDFRLECGNYRRQFGGVTPVGIFIEGKSRAGAYDVLGNIWEWTRSQRKGRYIIKGGAWDSTDLATSGIRTSELLDPSAREPNVGFRVLHRETSLVDTARQ